MNGRVFLDDEVHSARGVKETYWYLVSHFQGSCTHHAYILLARFFTHFVSPVEVSIRLPSILFGVGGVATVFFAAAKLFDRRTAVIAALLLALHPYHVFYSQIARGYAMAATLSLLSLIFFWKLIEEPRGRYAAAYVFCTVLAIYCHTGCVGIVLAEILASPIIAVKSGRNKNLLKTLLPAAVLIGVIGILVFLLYYPALDDMREYKRVYTGESTGGFSFGFVPLVLTAYMGGRGWSIYIFSLFSVLGFLNAYRKNPGGCALFLMTPLGMLLFYWLNDTGVFPWTYTRFFFVALPVLVIAAAGGLVAAAAAVARLLRIKSRPSAIVLSGIVLAFLLTTATKIIEISFGEKDAPWPKVISYLHETFPPDAHIVSMRIRFNSFYYYTGRAPLRPNKITPHPLDLGRELLSEPDIAWARKTTIYVVDLVPLENCEELDELNIEKFGNVSVLYRRKTGRPTALETLSDMEIITKQMIRYLEQNDTQEITADWVYWRVDAKHDHMLVSRRTLPYYYYLLAAVQERLGKISAAERSWKMGEWWSRRIRPPGTVRSSWTMLYPHTDFLNLSG